MSHATYELQAETRQRTGKGSAREIRRKGKIPAIIYGDKQPSLPITLSSKDIHQKIHAGGFLTTLVTIRIEGKEILTLPREFSLHPVKDTPLHVDFLRIGKDTQIKIKIPVHFINEDKSPGLKRGGALNIVYHEIELYCPVHKIPEHITVDIGALGIGDSIHISSIELPEGAKLIITERDFTIVTITGLSSEKETENESEEK